MQIASNFFEFRFLNSKKTGVPAPTTGRGTPFFNFKHPVFKIKNDQKNGHVKAPVIKQNLAVLQNAKFASQVAKACIVTN
jgi:hypothetical protein